MKKIKIAMVTTNLDLNGISSVIINYCKHINLNKFSITIFAGEPANEYYQKEFNKLKIKTVILPPRKPNTFKYYLALLKNLFKKNYDILHVHGNSSVMSIDLLVGYIAGIKVRIGHCHNSNGTSSKVHKLLMPLFNKLCTKRFACGVGPGEWMFAKKNYGILPNGIDISNFEFNLKIRNLQRKKLNLENFFVIGHVGRFNNQKNHEFILETFKYVASKKKEVILFLVGAGPNFNKIKQLIDCHPYKDRIILYGETNDIKEVYNMMDLFILPSKYEGFPLSLLEAQINGLYSIVSNKVAKDIDITANMEFLDIDDSKKWAIKINELIDKKIKRSKIDVEDDKIKKYDIKNNVKILEKEYTKLIKK